MDSVTPQQAAQLLNLISTAGASSQAVQRTLIDRFDLLQAMLRHPDEVSAMDASSFESFLIGGCLFPPGFLAGPSQQPARDMPVSYCYPEGWGLKPVDEQLRLLGQRFPGLELHAEAPSALPEGAEGWLLVPKPSRVAGSYHEALQRVLAMPPRQGAAFVTSQEGKLGPEHLRLTPKTTEALDRLERATPWDFLMLAVQCGLTYCSRSSTQVRRGFREGEFGLGPFEVACLLLTHPERLADYEHLGIDCPGCEYSPVAGGEFNGTLYFIWTMDGICLSFSSAEGGAPGFGSASAFMP